MLILTISELGAETAWVLNSLEELRSRAEALTCTDPQWELARPGTNLLLMSDLVAGAVAGGAALELSAETYALPPVLAEVADEVIAHRLRGRRYANESCARVMGLPRSAENHVVLASATYAAQQVTHEIGTALLGLSTGASFDILSLWASPEGAVLPLEETGMPNTIGVSVLALTADYEALLSTRATTLAVAPGAVDTTSSGGCELPKDLPGSFLTYLTQEALRELEEETGVPPGQVEQIGLLAVTRNLRRGGKVDFHFLATLTHRAHPLHGDEIVNITKTRPVRSPAELALTLYDACTHTSASVNMHAVAVAVTGALTRRGDFPQAGSTLDQVWGD